MRLATALIGLLAVISARAQQPDVPIETVVEPGLLGVYPINMEAWGSSRQPDSIPIGLTKYRDGRESGLEAGLTTPGENIWIVGRAPGGATLGLHATVAFGALSGASAYSPLQFGHASGNASYPFEHQSNFRRSLVDLAASYSLPLTSHSSVFGYIGLPGEPALGPPASYVRRFSGINDAQTPIASHWLEFTGPISQVFTLGYVWRNLKLEGSAFSVPEPDQRFGRVESLKLDSTSRRLSFNPAPNWALQISRGNLSNLDQLDPSGDVKRTTISATYNRAFDEAKWQTTLAWGRNARKNRESTNGYLLESTLKVAKAHAFFGRLEQVGSDDLIRENESLGRQVSKINKLTFGYLYGVPARGPIKLDVGALMSRHRIPATMTPSYGADPTSYMMFVRFKLR